ncbi:hypothetical protein SH139x_000283 [Planctomycetaceae bacterium SH139]
MKVDSNPYKATSKLPIPASKVAAASYPGRAILGSLLVMLPWPMLAIGACLSWSLLDTISESVLVFGGITMLFLLPLGFFVSSEWIFGVLIGCVWFFVLLLPLWFGKKPKQQKFGITVVYCCQSVFSAIQAGLGFLMILGKQA